MITIISTLACFICSFGGFNETPPLLEEPLSRSQQVTSGLVEDQFSLPPLSQEVLELLTNTSMEIFFPLVHIREFEHRIHVHRREHPFLLAVQRGDLDLVKLFTRSCFREGELIRLGCQTAAFFGHEKILRFLLRNLFHTCGCFSEQELLESCLIFASAGGHLELLKFMLFDFFPENGFFVTRPALQHCAISASARGHKNVVKFVLDKAFRENLFPLDFDLVNGCCIAASISGNLELVEFLFKKILPTASLWRESEILGNMFITATARGRLDIVRFLFHHASFEERMFLERTLLHSCKHLAFLHGHFAIVDLFEENARWK
jgi:hypothetical protein